MFNNRNILIALTACSLFVVSVAAVETRTQKNSAAFCPKEGKRCRGGGVWTVSSSAAGKIACECVKPIEEGCGRKEGKKCKGGRWVTENSSSTSGEVTVSCTCVPNKK